MKASAAAAAVLAVVALGVGKGAAAGQDAAAGVTMQPGQWEMVTQVTSVESPGASPEAQALLRGQVGQSETNQTCMTAELAHNPLRQMREMSLTQGPNCRFTDEVFGDGVIRVRMTCPSGEGPAGEMSMDGSFTATTLQTSLTIGVQRANPVMPGPGLGGMRLSANVSGRRIGECPATPAPPATEEPVTEPPPSRP
ncbi:MAG TPA: DUF3617 domain-containing protein [Allosphingosinicella sp.]|nr:DUF3617 domain-containing protein [Allosphingosinicella sp.]